MGTLEAKIYLCDGSTQTVTAEPGSFTFTGPQSGSGTSPLSQSVLASPPDYTVNATAGTGFMLVLCGSGNGTESTKTTPVPAGGTGSVVFYEAPIPPANGTLVANIYLCDGTTQTTTPESGSFTFTGPQSGSGASPLSQSVLPSPPDYTVNATAGTGFMLVLCGSSNGTATSKSTPVPSGGTGSVTFYVAPIPGTLAANIYLCDGTTQTTTPESGSFTFTGPQSGSGASPLSQSVLPSPPDYTVNATAGTGFMLVLCGSSNGTATSKSTPVPSGGTGSVTFYVAPIPGTLSAKIYLCAEGVQIPSPQPGSFTFTGPQSGGGPSPLSQSVLPGNYTVNATAGDGYVLDSCGNPPEQTSTQSVSVPSGGIGEVIFYESLTAPQTGSLLATIYLCTPDGVQTQTVEPGTLSTEPSVTISNGVPVTVPAGVYVVTATPGTGFQLVICQGAGANPKTVGVPAGGQGTAVFYEQPIPPTSGTLASSTGPSATNPATSVAGAVSPTQPVTGRADSLRSLVAAGLLLLVGFSLLVPTMTRREVEEA